MRITVIVGLIGAGKTWLAHHIKTSEQPYVSFDDVWHGGYQLRGKTKEEATAFFRQPSVIDGWWTWEPEWWKGPWQEDTLNLLAVDMDVHLVYLKMTAEQAYLAYLEKRKVEKWGHPTLTNEDTYRQSIPERISYMEGMVRKWGT